MTERLTLAITRAQAFEQAVCLNLNRLQRRWARSLFSTVSWLGNGLFWLLIACLLPFFGSESMPTTLGHLLACAGIGTLLYKAIKRLTARARPCDAGIGVRLIGQPLDRYSFPSGHTLHAVSFTLLVAHHAPTLLIVVLPFTVLVALSRVILGHHYPTDVAAGALLGAALAASILQFGFG